MWQSREVTRSVVGSDHDILWRTFIDFHWRLGQEYPIAWEHCAVRSDGDAAQTLSSCPSRHQSGRIPRYRHRRRIRSRRQIHLGIATVRRCQKFDSGTSRSATR